MNVLGELEHEQEKRFTVECISEVTVSFGLVNDIAHFQRFSSMIRSHVQVMGLYHSVAV